MAIVADDETIKPARCPGRHAHPVRAESAEAFPIFPRGTVPPPMPHGMIAANGKHIDSVWLPGDCRRIGIDVATQILPAAPAVAVPLMVKAAIVADNETVEPARFPGRHAHPVRAESAEAFPTFPRGAVPPAMPHGVVAADCKDIDPVGPP